MATKNNPKVGLIDCPHCDEKRSIHVTQQGAYKGFLYTRCPSCPVKKIDQSRDEETQRIWRRDAVFDEGFEHLRDMPEKATQKPRIDEQKPQTPQPARDSEPKPASKEKNGLPIGGLLAAFGGLSLIIFGAMRA